MAAKLNPTLGAEVVAWIERISYMAPVTSREPPSSSMRSGPGSFTAPTRCIRSTTVGRPTCLPSSVPEPAEGPRQIRTGGDDQLRGGPGACSVRGWRGKTPIGAPVTSPIIKCLATEEGQAGNTYDGIVYMLSEGLVNDAYPGLDVV